MANFYNLSVSALNHAMKDDIEYNTELSKKFPGNMRPYISGNMSNFISIFLFLLFLEDSALWKLS